ncbi:MAG: MarR family transcriptional regulator [Methanomicrobiaceae archaeon]|nr:MarR family transcriptional regulator [Methanomicrobiaceae archaeon]
MNRMNEIEAIPAYFGTDQLLHPSEIHTLQALGLNPDINVTTLGTRMGVSRGAASQIVSRLAGKGLIEKYRLPDNEKEVRLRLTPEGRIAFHRHEAEHEWVHRRIYERVGDLDPEACALLFSVFKAIDEVTQEMLDKCGHTARASGEGEKA